MKKIVSILMLIFAVSALLSACAAKPTEEPDKPVPADYAGKTNPLAGKPEAVTAGKEIYTTNCASCHGDGAKGDGPAGASLDPKPANLVEALSEDQDDRIFWVVSEGGPAAGFSASMVAWKATLTEDERWQAIAYIRTLK